MGRECINSRFSSLQMGWGITCAGGVFPSPASRLAGGNPATKLPFEDYFQFHPYFGSSSNFGLLPARDNIDFVAELFILKLNLPQSFVPKQEHHPQLEVG